MGYSLGKLRAATAGSGNATDQASLGTVHPDATNCKMSNYILENCGTQNGVAETTNVKYSRNGGGWNDLNAAGNLVDAYWVVTWTFQGWSFYTYYVSVEDNLSWKNHKASCAAQLTEQESHWTSWIYCAAGATCGYSPITSSASSAGDTNDAGTWNHSSGTTNSKLKIGHWNGNAGGAVATSHVFTYKYHDGFNNDSTNYDTWRGTVQFNTSNA